MTTKAPPVLKEKRYLVQIKVLNLSLESTWRVQILSCRTGSDENLELKLPLSVVMMMMTHMMKVMMTMMMMMMMMMAMIMMTMMMMMMMTIVETWSLRWKSPGLQSRCAHLVREPKTTSWVFYFMELVYFFYISGSVDPVFASNISRWLQNWKCSLIKMDLRCDVDMSINCKHDFEKSK